MNNRVLMYRVGTQPAMKAVVFWTSPRVNEADISDSIRDFSELEGPIESVVLLTWFHCASLYEKLLKSPIDLRVADESSVQGAVLGRDLKWARQNLSKSAVDKLLQRGYEWLFKVRGGVLVAPDGYHYEKLSGAHSTKFIRAANVFLNSNESALFALGVLEKLKLSEPPEICYTDTSAINVIGHIISDFYSGAESPNPIPVVSFGSYPGLEQGFEFDFTEKAVVIMSATTSGALERRLTEEYEIPESRICTLFAANKVKGPKVLFNVTDYEEEPFGEIINYDAKSCSFCEKGMPVIAISGDQFLPESAICRPFEILKSHLSVSSSKLVNDLAVGKVACNALRKDGKRRTFSFKLFGGEDCTAEAEIKRQFQLLFSGKGPYILVPRDQESLEWTQDSDYGVKCTEDPSELDGQRTIGVFCAINYGSGGPATVALTLRKIGGDLPRCFLLGISLYDDRDEKEKTLSTLKFRKSGWSYLVESVYDAFLPPQRNDKTPWDYEVQWWNSCKTTFQCIQDRIHLINQEVELVGGNLFIPSFDDKPLETTKGFAFFSDEERVGDQPLIFLAMCLALHDRRSARKNWSTTHNREVLDPRMFNRFTDPAIQAALLRGCLQEELNYSGDQQLSNKFAQIIDSLIAGEGVGYAAALGEFCYAVLSERVRLDGYVRADVLSKIAGLSSIDSQWATCFAELARDMCQK